MISVLKQVIGYLLSVLIRIQKTLDFLLKLSNTIESTLVKKIVSIQSSEFKKIDKLHIGCGRYFVKGWLNIDNRSTAESPHGRITYRNGIFVLNIDFHALDFTVFNKIKYIYSSHFIEHITHSQARKFLAEAYRCMDKGGIVRLSCPDMGLWIRNYYENNESFFQKYRARYIKDPDIKTIGDTFMSQCHGHNHKWNYDFESLKLMMEAVGFIDVIKKSQFDSVIPDITKLEPEEEGRRMESLYIEGFK